jgi:hypothetical protein
MRESRVLREQDEISLYELLSMAMDEGLDLRDVVVSYAGCGSHQILVHSIEEVTPADGTEPITLVRPRLEDSLGFDSEVGF